MVLWICPRCECEIEYTNDYKNLKILPCLFCGFVFPNKYYKRKINANSKVEDIQIIDNVFENTELLGEE